jgi:hypothetical protein
VARQQAPVAAVILGVALALALRYGRDELNQYLLAIGAQSGIPHWLTLVTPPIQALVVLLPGFVAGWVASCRILLCGFLTGLIGAALHSAIFSSWRGVAAAGLSEMLFLGGWALSNGIVGGLFAAAAASTAQVLRSNNRWRGP